MLNFILLQIHRRKLERMITKDEEYNKILQQSQVLDKYINKEMRKLALS